jgi:O-antigen/teichoic acid export membrane protein
MQAATRAGKGSVLRSETVRARLVRAVSWNFAAAVFSQGSALLLGVLLANILGRAEFGRFAIVQSTLLTVAAMSQLAMGYTATKYIAEFRNTDTVRTGRLLGLCSTVAHGMGVLAGLAVLLTAPFVAGTILGAPDLTPALRFVGIAVAFYVANGFQAGALAGFEAYPLLARAGAISGITMLSLCTALALVGGVTAAAAGLCVTGGVQYLLYRRLLEGACTVQRIQPRYTDMWLERRVLFRFAVPAALSGFSTLPALWVCNALLARSGGGFAELALYAAANNFRILILFIPNVLNSASGSLLNNQRGVGDDRRYSAVFRANSSSVAGVAVLMGLLVGLAGRPLLSLFGSGFVAAYPVLVILACAAVTESVSGAGYLIVQSHARLWLSFFAIALPRDLLVVGMAVWLIPKQGAFGLALSYTAGALLALATTLIIVVRLGIGINARTSGRSTPPADVAFDPVP